MTSCSGPSTSTLCPAQGNNQSSSSCSSSCSSGPMCIYGKDHGKHLLDSLQLLRLQNSLVDLDIVCEEQHIHVHKVIMAGQSKFFKVKIWLYHKVELDIQPIIFVRITYARPM